MLIEAMILVIGIILILLLSKVVIDYSIKIAYHYNLSGTFVGLTILSIGTSIPEIMTHIIGSVNIVQNPSLMNTMSSLLIGTNIGSDIFQQNFILPAIGLVGAVVVIRKNLLAEMGGLIAAACLVWLFSLGGVITRVEGALLLLAYGGYLLYLKTSKISEEYNGHKKMTGKETFLAFFLIIVCFIIMGFIADKVLDSSTFFVQMLPISASFFGVIMLGIASALPELMTSLIAVLKKKQDISAGILIGSNITNPLFGIGLGALISKYTVPNVVVFYDLPVKIFTAVLIYWFLWRSEDLNKIESIALISLFVLYLAFRFIYFPVDF
jgi:cation:H+ antiporter